jgi:hypothetical protein
LLLDVTVMGHTSLRIAPQLLPSRFPATQAPQQ